MNEEPNFGASFRPRLVAAISELQAAGIEEPRLEAQLLLGLALGVSRANVVAEAYPKPSAAQTAHFEALLAERKKRIPLAYLRGTQDFYGLTFRVSPAVLIPRPETELLAEFAREVIPSLESPWFADVGTGSGCIAVSVLRSLSVARCLATDLSEEALEIARQNAQDHGVSDRAKFLKTDILAGVEAKFGLVLSNPPYIPTHEITELAPEVRDYEPRMALDGGSDEGANLIRRLVVQAWERLESGGWLAMEVAKGQAPLVLRLLGSAGFANCGSHLDFAGIERLVFGQKQGELAYR